MNTNPYESPGPVDFETMDRFRILFVSMSWLSAILAALAFASAIFTGYQHYIVVSQSGGSLPTYIRMLLALVFCCSIGLAYSSTRWRKRRTRPAIIAFVMSIVLLAIGPYILLILLYGLPK